MAAADLIKASGWKLDVHVSKGDSAVTLSISVHDIGAGEPTIVGQRLKITQGQHVDYYGITTHTFQSISGGEFLYPNIGITPNAVRDYNAHDEAGVTTATVEFEPYLVAKSGIPDQTMKAHDKLLLDITPYFELVGVPASAVSRFAGVTWTSNPVKSSRLDTRMVGTSLELTAKQAWAHGIHVQVDGTDAAQGHAQQAFLLKIAPVNRAPARAKALAALTLSLSQATTLDLSTYFSDPDGDVMTYAASVPLGAPYTATITGASLTVTADGTKTGHADIKVTATDTSGSSLSQTARVTIVANQPPIATAAVLPKKVLLVGAAAETLDLSTFFSDPDGDALEYRVSEQTGQPTPENFAPRQDWGVQGFGPGTSLIYIRSVYSWSAQPWKDATDRPKLVNGQILEVTQAGHQRLIRHVLGAASATWDSATKTVNFQVTVGPGETFSAEEKTRAAAGRVRIGRGPPAQLAVNQPSQILEWREQGAAQNHELVLTPGTHAGQVTLRYTATDPAGNEATATQLIVVHHDPIAVGTIPAQTVPLDAPVTIDLRPYFRDAGGDQLTYTAHSEAPEVVPAILGDHHLVVTALGRHDHAVLVTVRATDPHGSYAEQQFDVTVAEGQHRIQPFMTNELVRALLDQVRESLEVELSVALPAIMASEPRWVIGTAFSSGTSSITASFREAGSDLYEEDADDAPDSIVLLKGTIFTTRYVSTTYRLTADATMTKSLVYASYKYRNMLVYTGTIHFTPALTSAVQAFPDFTAGWPSGFTGAFTFAASTSVAVLPGAVVNPPAQRTGRRAAGNVYEYDPSSLTVLVFDDPGEPSEVAFRGVDYTVRGNTVVQLADQPLYWRLELETPS